MAGELTMPNTREKLIELLNKFIDGGFRQLNHASIEHIHNSDTADYLIANGVRLDKKQATSDETSKWIPVTERLPEPETEVLVLAERKIYSIKNRSWRKVYFVLTGMYEDGKKHTEDSEWRWEDDGFEYDEETDDYIIPEGWWEYKHYIDDEVHNYCIDDKVTHWMPLPPCPEDAK